MRQWNFIGNDERIWGGTGPHATRTKEVHRGERSEYQNKDKEF